MATEDELTDIAIARMVARADPLVLDVIAEHLIAQRPTALRLTDAEQDAVLAAARPLTPEQRDAFLQDVVIALRGVTAIGPGLLHRILVELQARHFVPPKTIVDDADKRHLRGALRHHAHTAGAPHDTR